MPFSERDENLNLAATTSLQESLPAPPVSPTNQQAIDLTSDTDDEDEDLRKVIAFSIQESKKVTCAESPQHSVPPTHVTTTSVIRKQSAQGSSYAKSSTISAAAKTNSGFMGLDREALEQERRARLGKRKRDSSPERALKQVLRPLVAEAPQVSIHPYIVPKAIVSDYPKGAIKRTFATKYPRTDDITFGELLQASNVNIAVISSFVWDAGWLHKKLNPKRVKQIWIMNAKDQDVQQRWVREMKETGVPNLKIHFPPMHGQIHSMHSKFMLLFGKNKLRFAVPTANMTQIDWGEIGNDWQPGVMENSVFLIDLPRRADGKVGSKDELTEFGKELVYFLEKQEIGQKVIEGVLKFDFSETGHLAFVHSIGGSHKSELDHPTGLPCLAQAVRNLRLDHIRNIWLDYAASSLGAINNTLLQRIYLAASGESFTDDTKISNVRDHIRIYFPTHETVEKSMGGPDCGGIISLTRQYYNASTFPKECLRDYDSTRRGMLSHNKLLFARGRKSDGKPFAWAYVGSANVSESAWGGQKVLKSGKMGALNIRNWECGIVMPVPESRFESLKLDEGELPPMAVFEGTIEVPFKYPGERYEGKQPWFFDST